jgi:predicted ATP-binding protein involved in virulence
MQLKHLTLTNFRAFTHVEFDFQPGLNLLVGINGAGKSTVLDALRFMLSQAIPTLTSARKESIYATIDDITKEYDWLYSSLQFVIDGMDLEYEVRKWREKTDSTTVKKGEGDSQTDEQKDIHRLRHLAPLPKGLNTRGEQPLVLFFSTHRSLVDPKQSAARGQSAAFANALKSDRGLRLQEFAEWWLVQETLAKESQLPPQENPYTHRLTILDKALTSFLDNCTNLRAVRQPKATLQIDKDGKTLDIRMLSDGERSMITLVLDLARRLTIAHPELDNPLTDGKAVVLIDEIDLHLHPRWQRTITSRLTETFPNCQFIATTHSPQIVGEVSPDNIILLEDGKVTRPDQSLGMDTNWILRHLMGVDEREPETQRMLEQIEALIEAEEYDQAVAQIDNLRQKIGEFPDLVSLQARIDMIMFLSDEVEYDEEGI